MFVLLRVQFYKGKKKKKKRKGTDRTVFRKSQMVLTFWDQLEPPDHVSFYFERLEIV